MSHSQQQPASFGQQLHSFAVPPAGQPPRKERAALKIAVGAVCACTVLGLGAAVGGDGGGGTKPGAKPAPTVAVTFTAKPVRASVGKPEKAAGKAAVAGSGATIGQGSHRVGEDIAAGTYRTGGPAASGIPRCSWARAKDSSGARGSLIAHGTLRGPARITLTKGETFETSGCRRWTKVG
ncbi:hypothetical protein HXP44_28740 [Streptomyces sioyaensis]|uniref:Uncharacterized protein n=1 Tax=Streptomyces sioyaensis TaxID=67364 RepID=A0A4Q1R9S9_9ACTN|nr:hypothetical protein [Streptomyces sioyaensis]MBM4795935.1 hypothetical protein [Streptomyces sioyaensis]RXS70180.1 hypothetical protein EST54_03525 [Streptomyces sioyaensis]